MVPPRDQSLHNPIGCAPCTAWWRSVLLASNNSSRSSPQLYPNNPATKRLRQSSNCRLLTRSFPTKMWVKFQGHYVFNLADWVRCVHWNCWCMRIGQMGGTWASCGGEIPKGKFVLFNDASRAHWFWYHQLLDIKGDRFPVESNQWHWYLSLPSLALNIIWIYGKVY